MQGLYVHVCMYVCMHACMHACMYGACIVKWKVETAVHLVFFRVYLGEWKKKMETAVSFGVLDRAV